MWFRSLLASWISGSSRGRRPQPRPAHSRLVLEQLEDRSLPSSYSAATVSDLIADIKAANTAGGANTIALTAPSTSPYVLTRMNNGTLGRNGLPVIAAHDNLTVLGNGDTINGKAGYTNQFRLLEVAGGASLTLVNLTLSGGYMQDYPSAYGQAIGGGAICNLGTLLLNGVTVTGAEVVGISGTQPYGTAGGDGSIGWNSPSMSAVGGGIWSRGSLTLENGTLLQGNVALGSSANTNYGETPSNAMGGAVYVAGGTVNISNTIFTGNGAAGYPFNLSPSNGYGGALYVAAGQVTLTETTVNGNEAAGAYGGSGLGGGVYVGGGTVTLTSDTLETNTASFGSSGAGGGLFISKAATVYMDPFTLAQVINNTAAVDPNIDGTYIVT